MTEGPDWEALAKDLARHEGALRVASMLRRGYGNTVDGVIAEFDRVATNEERAKKFAADMAKYWWSVTGPNGEYFEVEDDQWEQVAEHIHSAHPKIAITSFFDSQAHKSALLKADPQGRRFDVRPP